jgi:HEAT repeat protein
VNPGDSGGPVVNDRGDQVAVVRSYSPGQRGVSQFIDIEEVLAFLNANLAARGIQVSSLAPTAREALGGTGAELRKSAVTALGLIRPGPDSPEAKAAVQALCEMLKDRDATVRNSAVVALGELKEAAASAALAMLELAADPQVDQAVLVENLAKLGKEAVRLLQRQLLGRSKPIRLAAIRALGAMGPVAADASFELFERSRYERDPVLKAAAKDAYEKTRKR